MTSKQTEPCLKIGIKSKLYILAIPRNRQYAGEDGEQNVAEVPISIIVLSVGRRHVIPQLGIHARIVAVQAIRGGCWVELLLYLEKY